MLGAVLIEILGVKAPPSQSRFPLYDIASRQPAQNKICFSRNYLLFLHVNNFKMNTKLTLNLNKSIIENAKDYAKENSVSLSKLIENYLSSLTKKQQKEIKVSPLVESLTGIIPSETDQKNNDDYYEYLNKKYS